MMDTDTNRSPSSIRLARDTMFNIPLNHNLSMLRLRLNTASCHVESDLVKPSGT
jgi:hypothetical protein